MMVFTPAQAAQAAQSVFKDRASFFFLQVNHLNMRKNYNIDIFDYEAHNPLDTHGGVMKA